MSVNRKECKKAGIDPDVVEKIAKGLSRYGRQAEKLGIQVFGGSGSGTLRKYDGNDLEGRPLILADIDGVFDGGDGSECEDSEGFMRGE